LHGDIVKIDASNTSEIPLIPTEKIYIHFDRSSYFLGDKIWFKVYLLDGATNIPSTTSKVVYVDLIDQSNQVVKTRTIHIKDGGGDGEFDLGLDMAEGLYTIRSYTNYMRNFDPSFFFRKDIYINSFNSLKKTHSSEAIYENKAADSIDYVEVPRPDIQFFPEGGHMVAGLPARLGFKAIDHLGLGIHISGVLLNDADKELMGFESIHLGMGSVTILPENTNGLKARVYYKGEEFIYELPAVKEEGVIMRVINRGDAYQINLQSSLKQGVNGLELIGEQRGNIVCKANLSGTQAQGTVKVPMVNLEEGIIKFTLFNKKKEPLCERLVFLEKDIEYSKITIKPTKPIYETRTLVELEVSMKNTSNLPANVSIAVTDMDTNTKSACGFDILTYLLLNSEIKGEIEDACYYFNSTDPDRKRVLDLLLITQGWRNYLWNQFDASSVQELAYPFEAGKDFKGSVRSAYNKEIPVHSEVILTYKNRSVFGQDEAKTFGEGKFSFPSYLFKDSTSIIIEARKKQNKKTKKSTENDDFQIIMNSESSPEVTDRPHRDFLRNAELNQISETTHESEYLDQLYADQPDYEQLENVDIKMQGADKQYTNPYQRDNMRYTEPRHRIDYKEEKVIAVTNNDLFFTFFNRTPGITLATGGGFAGNSGSSGGYYYRGSKIVFFLNGVRHANAASITSLVNANDVSFIDLVSGTQAVSYSVNVAVIVYTKTPEERLRYGGGGNKGVVNFIYPGMYKAKEFYSPIYKTSNKNEQLDPDFRITLHWKPSLRLNPNTKTKISFYTADPEANYRIELEGITLDGLPVREEAFFEVRD